MKTLPKVGSTSTFYSNLLFRKDSEKKKNKNFMDYGNKMNHIQRNRSNGRSHTTVRSYLNDEKSDESEHSNQKKNERDLEIDEKLQQGEEISFNIGNEEPSIIKESLINFIRGYKAYISPILPPACRFLPTCSEYGIEAIQTYGIYKGCILTCWRILRCNPFGGSGYDPVQWPPPKFK